MPREIDPNPYYAWFPTFTIDEGWVWFKQIWKRKEPIHLNFDHTGKVIVYAWFYYRNIPTDKVWG